MDEKKVESIIFGLKETIVEQKAEIERLAKVEIDLIGKIADKSAEIERLTEENEYLDMCGKQFLADYQKCEIERAELQKQVELLKDRLAKTTDAIDTALYVTDACQKKLEQAVKDTAQEALEAFICKLVNSRLVSTKDDLYVEMLETKDDLLKEKYGVEVE